MCPRSSTRPGPRTFTPLRSTHTRTLSFQPGLLPSMGVPPSSNKKSSSALNGTPEGDAMLSARNQLVGTVKSVKLGDVMAEVVIQVGQFEIVSAITRGSAEAMALKVGDQVKAIIKSTEVIVDKP